MAICPTCGQKLSFFGKCTACEERERKEAEQLKEAAIRKEIDAKKKQEQQARQREQEKQKAIQSIVVTTENQINSAVLARHTIIMASVESALDVNVDKARGELLMDLKRQAYNLGANAVVGVSINFVETYNATIGAAELKKFRMIAYGTAMTL